MTLIIYIYTYVVPDCSMVHKKPKGSMVSMYHPPSIPQLTQEE